MTEQQIDRERLRKLADAATDGPWEKVADHRESRVIATGGEHWLWIADTGSVDSPHAQNDAEFIAAARNAVPALLDALAAAEHRATRAEARAEVRGRAVAIHRKRAREAEASRDEWRQTALDERGAALDALEQIKARDERIKAVRDVLDRPIRHVGWDDPLVSATLIRRALDQ